MATYEKRGRGYRITASCGYDVDGTQERPRMTWRPEPGMTEKQIEKELNRQMVLFEEDCKEGFSEKNVKFQLFAENRYFVDYAPENLKRKTIDSYQHYEDRVYAAIGHLRMDKITPTVIQKFVRGLLKGDKKHKPLSKKSAKNYLSFVSSVFEYAIDLKAAKSNPCRSIKISIKGRPEHDCYTLEEAQHFLDLLLSPGEPLMYQVFFILAIYGGFRRGELLGIEWKDIDFKHCVISIHRESLYTKETGIYTDVPKTPKGFRSRKLLPEIFIFLQQYHVQQNLKRLKVGDRWIDSDRLFVAWNGAPIYPSAPYNWLDRFCARTGMRKAKQAIHSLRHFNASLMIYCGADVKEVADALGHAQASTTLNIYAHTFQQAEAERMGAMTDKLPLKISK